MGKKKKKKIRPLAMCIFRRDDKIFVSDGYDALKDQNFYRAIGGGIEFGEQGHETVQREVMEEIEAEVSDLVYVGTLENIFNYEGTDGHEICLMYTGRFLDAERNRDDYQITAVEDSEVLYTASWKPLTFFEEKNAPLYPQGLLELIQSLDE